MKVALEVLRRPWRQLYERSRCAISIVNGWLLVHPTLLIPLAAVYALVSLIAAIGTFGIGLVFARIFQNVFGFDSDFFFDVVTLLFIVFFVPLVLVVWLHYLYLGLRSVRLGYRKSQRKSLI
jgi:hypothetical protein